MSTDDDSPPEVDPDELIERAQEERADAAAKHETLLEAAANGEEALVVEETTTTIGDADITVRTDLPGSVARRIDPFLDGELPPGELIDVMAAVLSEQTESISAEGVSVTDSGQIEAFYRDFIEGNDIEASATLAFERVIEEPCDIERGEREQALQSFRGT